MANPIVVDRTKGKMAGQTVQRWAWALLRSLSYADWAVANNNDALLRTGILVSQRAVNTAAAAELGLIQRAKTAHGKIEESGPTFVELDLVEVPRDLQARIQNSGFGSAQFAWVVHIQGPERTDLVAGNTSTTITSVGTDAKKSTFNWGHESERTPLGPVWTSEGNSDCDSDPGFRALCGD